MSTTVTTPTGRLPAGTWAVDPAHSSVGFRVKHLGIANVSGTFSSFEGTLRVGEGSDSPEAFGSVDAASIDTGDASRDAHLRSADFLDAERYPQITFTSTAIREAGEGAYEIDGELTLHGVTGELTLSAQVTGTERDPYGNERIGLEITGEIDRDAYGVSFNQALGSGNVLVSNAVKLRIDVSAIRET